MPIVIDIPEDIYIHLLQRYKYQDTNDIGLSELDKAGVAIKNGKPLPKGHGDLIDRGEVIKSLFDYHNGTKTIGQCIDDVQTIIEADKEE